MVKKENLNIRPAMNASVKMANGLVQKLSSSSDHENFYHTLLATSRRWYSVMTGTANDAPPTHEPVQKIDLSEKVVDEDELRFLDRSRAFHGIDRKSEWYGPDTAKRISPQFHSSIVHVIQTGQTERLIGYAQLGTYFVYLDFRFNGSPDHYEFKMPVMIKRK